MDIVDIRDIFKDKICEDVLGIIEDMLYIKCDDCNKYKNRDDVIELKDKRHICLYCFSDVKYRFCRVCKEAYENTGNNCYVCGKSDCFIYRRCDECELYNRMEYSFLSYDLTMTLNYMGQQELLPQHSE